MDHQKLSSINPGTYVGNKIPVSKQRPLKVMKPKGSLYDMTSDYVVFNHGLIAQACGFDPLRVLEENTDFCDTSICYTDHFYIKGIENRDLNRLLCFAPKEQWPKISAYLDQTAITQKRARYFGRALKQLITIPDPFLRKSGTDPLVGIYLYGWDSNLVCLHFKPTFLMPSLELIRDVPLPETVQFAESLFREKSNPFESTEINKELTQTSADKNT